MFDLLQAMAIIEPAAMDSLKNRGSGTGPFKFVEWVPGDHTTLERNTAYWNQGAPWADRVVFKVFSDSDAMVAALQSGICDLIIAVPPKDTARLAKEFNMVRGTPGALTYEVRVNGAKPPFDKKEARQALHYAIDRQGIVNNVLFGVSEPTVLPFSRNSPAYDRSTLAKYPFDLKRAKEMLDKAGLAGGRAECLTLPQFPELPAISQVLKADLAKIGFTLDIVVQDSTLYYKRMLGGDFQLCPSFSGNTQKYPTRVALNSIYRPGEQPGLGQRGAEGVSRCPQRGQRDDRSRQAEGGVRQVQRGDPRRGVGPLDRVSPERLRPGQARRRLRLHGRRHGRPRERQPREVARRGQTLTLMFRPEPPEHARDMSERSNV